MRKNTEKDTPKNTDGLPEIAQSLRDKKSVMMIVSGAGLIAILLFFHFNPSHSKSVIELPEESYSAAQSATSSSNSANTNVSQQQMAALQEKKDVLQARLSAPLMIGAIGSGVDGLRDEKSDDTNNQAVGKNTVDAPETAIATTMSPLNSLIAQGSLIHAILESATNSDLPGLVRAIVSEPVYSEDGTRILITQGSRLIGCYQSGIVQGQSRIAIVWTRLIESNGISIQLSSPSVDALGVAGMGADDINRHFWERFSTASLLSLIGVSATSITPSGNESENLLAAYRSGVASSFSHAANETLQRTGNIPPTLTTYQGKPIIVFVAKDLRFTAAIQTVASRINVF